MDRALRAYAGWAVVLVLVAALATGLSSAAAQEDADELSDPVAFAETTYANVCAECHGGAGQGGTVPGSDDRAPALAGNPDVTVPYVDLVLRTGRMPPAGDPFDNRAREVVYDDVERAALVGWMAEAFGLEGEVPEVGEGDVANGLEVFARNCAHCHGNGGEGGTAGADAWTPQVNDDHPVAIVEAIRVGPFEMPQFGEGAISEQEADDVAAYLRSIEESPGTPVLGIVELNPVFASGFVAVLAVALIGSLLYIGGRPVPFEQVASEEVPTSVRTPEGRTPMPGDPTYEEPMDIPGKQQDHPPLPYTDEPKGTPTSGAAEQVPSDVQGADRPGAPRPDPPHGQPADRADLPGDEGEGPS
jgi:ubiquinol-cytochrome c reductase cytochrome c subunit